VEVQVKWVSNSRPTMLGRKTVYTDNFAMLIKWAPEKETETEKEKKR